ncbi:MAG TPA: alpha/beta hydrolase [Verrucomicrobiae bacterium]|nr:alpha/beta hydrolase [Verrucomicrobiae bacterium]
MKRVALQFEVSGTGNVPLICVHGWGCDGGQFEELSRRLEAEFRIFRVDLPGHGRTAFNDFTPGFANYAQTIVDFVVDQKLQKPVLLGHSMGGVLSMLAAGLGQIQPRAVINLDGSFPPADQTLVGQRTIRGWLDQPDFRERLAGALRESYFLPSERDERCEAIIHMMCSAPEAVLRFLPEQIEDLRPERDMPRVTAPVLYVASAHPRFDSVKAQRLIPHLQLNRIPGVGHFLHVYAVEQVAAMVKSFLGENVGR